MSLPPDEMGAERTRILVRLLGAVLDDDPGKAHAALRTLREQAQVGGQTDAALSEVFERDATALFRGRASLLKMIEQQGHRIRTLEGDLHLANEELRSARNRRRSIEVSGMRLARSRFIAGMVFGSVSVIAALLAWTLASGADHADLLGRIFRI